MKVTAYICARWNRYDKEWEYRTLSYDPGTSDYLCVEIRELEFESPNDRELKARFAAVLREKKQQTLADAQVEVNDIDQQIQELLALEDHSEKAS